MTVDLETGTPEQIKSLLLEFDEHSCVGPGLELYFIHLFPYVFYVEFVKRDIQ